MFVLSGGHFYYSALYNEYKTALRQLFLQGVYKWWAYNYKFYSKLHSISPSPTSAVSKVHRHYGRFYGTLRVNAGVNNSNSPSTSEDRDEYSTRASIFAGKDGSEASPTAPPTCSSRRGQSRLTRETSEELRESMSVPVLLRLSCSGAMVANGVGGAVVGGATRCALSIMVPVGVRTNRRWHVVTRTGNGT